MWSQDCNIMSSRRTFRELGSTPVETALSLAPFLLALFLGFSSILAIQKIASAQYATQRAARGLSIREINTGEKLKVALERNFLQTISLSDVRICRAENSLVSSPSSVCKSSSGSGERYLGNGQLNLDDFLRNEARFVLELRYQVLGLPKIPIVQTTSIALGTYQQDIFNQNIIGG